MSAEGRSQRVVPLGERAAHEATQRLQAGVGDSIVREQAVPPAGDEAPITKQGQVLARVGLGNSGESAQLLDGALLLEQHLE